MGCDPNTQAAGSGEFEAQSFLSKTLGLDRHPKTRDAINDVLVGAADRAGLNVTNTTNTIDGILGSLKGRGVKVSAAEIVTVLDAIIDESTHYDAETKAQLKKLVGVLVILGVKS